MAFFLPRKLLAVAMLAALSLPNLAQAETAAPAPAVAPVAAPAAEATPPAARPGPRAQRMGMHRHHRHMQMMHSGQTSAGAASSWQERRAEHLAQLKGQLQLSPAQEAAWTEFTGAMDQKPGHAQLGWEGMEQLTTPERIDRMRVLHAQRAAEMDRRGDAVKALYAQLNPAQQKTFDAHHQAYTAHTHQMMGGARGRAMPGPGAEGTAQPGWQHPDCVMEGTARRHGRRGAPRNVPAPTPAPAPAPAQ